MNFQEIKTALVAKGLATQEMAEAATQKVLVVEGEFNEDETIYVEKVSAGWIVGDFQKCIPVNFPISEGLTEKQIKETLAAQFPGVRISVKAQ